MPGSIGAEAAAGFVVSYCAALYGFETCGALRQHAARRCWCWAPLARVGVAAIDVRKGDGRHRDRGRVDFPKKREAREGARRGFRDRLHETRLAKELEPLTGRRDVDLVYDPVGGDFSERRCAASRRAAGHPRRRVRGRIDPENPAQPPALLKRCAIVGVDWGGYIRANPADNVPLLKTPDEMDRGRTDQPRTGGEFFAE